jgi:anti-sigma factor RsiW
MNEHVSQWTGAYLDGELGADRRAQVEAHLAACPACRQELEGIRQLSTWLQGVPLPESLPSPGNFAARLAPRLPARPPARPAASPVWTAPGPVWWLIPLSILGGWLAFQIIYQAAFLLQEWSWALAPLAFLNAILAWLNPAAFAGAWIDLAAPGLQNAIGLGVPPWLAEYTALWQGLAVQFGLNTLAALLFMSWLAGLAARRIHLAYQREAG